MNAAGILRVGIFTLIISMTLRAETIPFDYWYGRIIGRTQIRSIHNAYNDETGVLTTNVKVGYGDDVSVGLGSLFTIEPTSQSNAFQLRFVRPKVSANAAVGERTRWVVNVLDWRDDTEIRINGEDYRITRESSFLSDQTIRMLHEDIEYDSTRSLYSYTSGMLLQPRNWSLDVRLRVNFSDASRRRSWPKYISQGQEPRIINSSEYQDSRLWSISAAFGYGISSRLQIKVGWLLERRSQPNGRTEEFYQSVDPDSVFVRYSERSEARRRNYELYFEPVFLQSDHHWVSIRPSFRSLPSSSEVDYENPAEAAIPRETRRYTNTDRTYGIGIKHTWISAGRPISRSQILDDYGGYYGNRLEAGTLRISTAADWSLGRTASERWKEFGDGTRFDTDRYESRVDQLTATSEVTYYSKYNLDLSLKATLVRRSNGGGQLITDAGYYHTQDHYFDIRLSYHSYRWSPEQRRDISWSEVSDMDYLYGPLLRPGDFRSSISVSPPADRWTYRDVKESVFNFFNGESDNQWKIACSSAYGLCDGVEVGLGVGFRQEWYRRQDDQRLWEYQFDQWSIYPNICWQPGQGFRVDFSASEKYSDTDDFTSYGGLWHEYRHTWSIYMVYSVLI